ncbi:hypothetical protein Zmor_028319 [Zophobas morio]|uniref:RNA-directed DNA polymerase from mobile element jockey n=1 Tax=Zophobas morio TaxID=2755281 RepID=A0AA38HSJ5_9CUCU|nr:hypothetical protein Zmor_028319 [Zophobas morio]
MCSPPRRTLGLPPNVRHPHPQFLSTSTPPHAATNLHFINIATANIDNARHKMHALKNFIETDNIQVLGLTETKTKREIKIPCFTTYHRPSTMNNARGTALIISNKIPSTRHDLPPNLANLEATAVNILIANISLTIICYYIPPQEALSSFLIEYASQLPNAILWATSIPGISTSATPPRIQTAES